MLVRTRAGRGVELVAVDAGQGQVLCRRSFGVRLWLGRIDRSGGRLYRPCTADGGATDGDASVWGVRALPGDGEWRVVSQRRALRGYRLPAADES
ncbi:hypothetical protein FXB39_08870 [Nocardioides sp. BGMRC 2183]|nr:hypothetical protein FXB39_08870 [Nocardioides sp. BGMRC 2183]